MTLHIPKPGAFYSVGYSDPRTIYNSIPKAVIKYGDAYKHKRKWASPLMPHKKVDAHEYKTEAKDMTIEACKSFWIIKYGDGPIPSIDTAEQDDLTWEVGNRLFWAGELEHDIPNDTYTCKS